MNATQVCERLSKAIQMVEAWRDAQRQYPKEAAAAEVMFQNCYPERAKLIRALKAEPVAAPVGE